MNLYLGLVVSYIKDLNPNITSVLQHHDEGLGLQTASSSNQPKVHTQTLWHFSILRFLVSVFYRVYGQWSVLLFSLGKLVNGYIRHRGVLYLGWGLGPVNFSMGVLETSKQKIMD